MRRFILRLVPIWISRFRFLRRSNRIKQAAIRDIRDARAAPATPQRKMNMKIESPMTFIIFMIMDACMEIFELPMERNRAAHEL